MKRDGVVIPIALFLILIVLVFVIQPALALPGAAQDDPEDSQISAQAIVNEAAIASKPILSNQDQLIGATSKTSSRENSQFVPDEIIVSFRSQVSLHQNQNNIVTSSNSSVQHLLDVYSVVDTKHLFIDSQRNRSTLPTELQNVYLLELAYGTDVLEATNAFSRTEEVYFAQPNYYYHPVGLDTEALPNDPLYNDQWGLHGTFGINAEEAWQVTTGDSAIRIAVIDTGLEIDHPDLSGKYVGGYDYVRSDNTPDDENGHGSHVAGIAAGISDNFIGIAGVSWESPVLSYKVCGPTGGCDSLSIINAVLAAADVPDVWVMNLSLSGRYTCPPLETTTYAYARSRGVLIVAAAGNNTSSSPVTPASCENVLAVGAIKSDGEKLLFPIMGHGLMLSLLANPSNLPTLVAIATKSGTSMASPFVAGAAALVYAELMPNISRTAQTADNVEEILKGTAHDMGAPGFDNIFGYGLVDVGAAVSEVAGPPRLDVHIARWTAANQAAEISVKVRDSLTGSLLSEKQVTTDSSGWARNLVFQGLSTDTYDIVVKGQNQLSVKQADIQLTAGETATVDVNMPPQGDFNGDDRKNIIDFSAFARIYNLNDPEIDHQFDLNGDDQVNIIDFNIFANGYPASGDDYVSDNLTVTDSSSTQSLITDSTSPQGSLTLAPMLGNFSVGTQFDTNVILDGDGATLNGSDVIIHYDPCALEVISITNGSQFTNSLHQQAYPDRGEIEISVGVPLGSRARLDLSIKFNTFPGSPGYTSRIVDRIQAKFNHRQQYRRIKFRSGCSKLRRWSSL
ncbi:MAG: S8 family serine peptidase [Chloroflexota bacterium]